MLLDGMRTLYPKLDPVRASWLKHMPDYIMTDNDSAIMNRLLSGMNPNLARWACQPPAQHQLAQ